MAAINGKKIIACVCYANPNGGAGEIFTHFTTWDGLHKFMLYGAERYGYVYTYAGTRDGVAVFTEQHRRNLEKESPAPPQSAGRAVKEFLGNSPGTFYQEKEALKC